MRKVAALVLLLVFLTGCSQRQPGPTASEMEEAAWSKGYEEGFRDGYSDAEKASFSELQIQNDVYFLTGLIEDAQQMYEELDEDHPELSWSLLDKYEHTLADAEDEIRRIKKEYDID